MAKIPQEQLEAKILDGRHTYAGLVKLYGATPTQAMQIDRTLQKLRRNKEITLVRQGRKVIWVPVALTETMKAAAEAVGGI